MPAKLGRSYSSVFDMLREELPECPELAEAAFDAYGRDQISGTLLCIRTQSGVSREELSRRSGLSTEKIAKMEDKGDGVRFNDIIKYMEGLDHTARLLIEGRNNNLAGILRWHFQAIAAIMTKFADLAQGDPDISAGVFEHYNNESKKMQDTVLPICDAMAAKVKLQEPADVSPVKGGLVFEYHSKNGGVPV